MMSHAAYERKLEVARGAGSKYRKHINKVTVLHFHSSDHAVVTSYAALRKLLSVS